ncbi:MAG TPA: Crp/Fnr family transcriptional regulator [Aeromonadales bacterium]|nr:Crp/Fnr family transcriptional regulator [Aeromonadales bacterium]
MHPFHLQFLKSHLLVSSFTDDQFQDLVKSVHLHALKSSEHLFQHGDEAVCFYILVSGRMKLYRTSIEGQEKVVDIIQPGDSFAEAIMFMQKSKYPVYAQALKPSEVIAINMKKYRELLSHSLDTCFHLMADLSMRIHRRLNEIDTLTLQNATFRVIHFLMAKIPSDDEKSFTIALPASKRLIASQLAIQPETFSRILNKLKQQGIIEVNGRDILVKDRQMLIDYSG